MTWLPWIVGAGLTSLLLTPAVAALARRWGLVDVPNERTLHQGAVPRVGGLAFVVPFLGMVAAVYVLELAPPLLAFGLLAGAGPVAAVALVDDVRAQPAWLRLGLWTVPLVVALGAMGWMTDLDLGFVRAPLGLGGTLLALVGGLWLVTLYNFMDGVDGLAAGQAVVVSTAAAGLLWQAGDTVTAFVCALLAASVGGFVVWNWHPARVFMGDVGSAFLGAAFAVLALYTEVRGTLPMLTWHILLMPFLVDATFTLIRRMVTGKPWRRPHREHAYQRAVLSGRTHAQVTAAILALDAVMVGLAWTSRRVPDALLPCALIACAVTAWLWRMVGRRCDDRRAAGSLP